MKMLNGMLRYQLPVFLADMGGQSCARHSCQTHGRVLSSAVNVVGNIFPNSGIHGGDGIGPASPFNLLQALTLPLAGSNGGVPKARTQLLLAIP